MRKGSASGLTYVHPLFYSMNSDKLIGILKEGIKPALKEIGADMIDFTIKRISEQTVIQLLIDKKNRINLDECASVNRVISRILEEEDLISDKYLIDVSSPGLDRPFKERADFKRVVGQEIDIWLNEKVLDKVFVSGKLKNIVEDSITIEDNKNNELAIPLDAINKAKLKI